VVDLRRPSLKLVLGLVVLVLCLVEGQSLIHIIRSQTRLREHVVQSVTQAFLLGRPRIELALLPGGPTSWRMGLEEALRSMPVSEAELFDAVGNPLLDLPHPSPLRHWPASDELAALKPESVFVVGPIVGQASRVLLYAVFSSGGKTVILRLGSAVPELIEDLRDRRDLLVGHGLALLVLVLAGGLALSPSREPTSRSSPRALDAYVEALERLRARGETLSRAHEAERHRLEEAVQDKEAMARAGELTAGIVHELRNGLGTITGYARLVERCDASAEVTEAARGIREECETLEVVIRRFMDFVKHEKLNLARFDLSRLLSRVVARESRSRVGGEVQLIGGEVLELTGDEELLERAFENLVRNAREAAGPAGHVFMSFAPSEGSVDIGIADDGPGLSNADTGALRPFFTTKPGGLGLGLPIAHKIIALHQGELDFHNRSPRGLEVTVRLPLTGPRL
jgi:signal transduction histidine kinase